MSWYTYRPSGNPLKKKQAPSPVVVLQQHFYEESSNTTWSWDVVWPAIAVNNNFSSFDTTTGKLIKDSWYNVSSFAPALWSNDNYVTDSQLVLIAATTASFTTDDEVKLDNITVTQAVNLDQMETDIAALANGMVYKGNWDASVWTFPWAGVAKIWWFYTVSVVWTVWWQVFNIWDRLIAIVNNASTTVFASNWSILDATDAVTSVFGRLWNVVATNGDYTASQITNVPSGNLASVTVQAALDELQADINTRITALSTDTLTNKGINLANNTLTTTKALLNTSVSDWDVLFVWDVVWVTDWDKWDVIVSASGSTRTVDNNAITFAKMQAITDGRLLWASWGTAVEEITIGTWLVLSGNQLSATASNWVSWTLNVNTTAVGNVWTGEDDLITYSVSGGTLSTNGDYLTFDVSGTVSNSINAKRIRIKFWSTTIFDTGPSGIPMSTAFDWTSRWEIIRTSATTFKANVYFNSAVASLSSYAEYTLGTETLANALVLKMTGEATTNDDIVQETMITRVNSTTTDALSAYAPKASPTFTGTVTLPSGQILTTPVINWAITGTWQSTSATPSTIMMRDSNGLSSVVNLNEWYTTTATAAWTTTLTVASTYLQFFTGSTTQTVVLPVASTLVLGQQYYIRNNSTGLLTIQSSGANTVRILAGGTRCIVTCILASGTTAASWSAMYVWVNITDGKLLSASNSITLAGTDSTTMTFPSTSATIARTDAAQTFTGVQTMVAPVLGTPSVLVATNATGTATNLTSWITNALKSATTTVDVSAATAPTNGQVLTATSSTTATRQTPSVSSTKQFRITIPWEQVQDTASYQGLYFYNDTGATITISNVAVAVGKAAAWSWAAYSVNIYKSSGTAADWLNTSAVNLFTSAIALTTSYTALTNVPNTTTVESGRWLTARITSSAGATNKASDAQIIITYS